MASEADGGISCSGKEREYGARCGHLYEELVRLIHHRGHAVMPPQSLVRSAVRLEGESEQLRFALDIAEQVSPDACFPMNVLDRPTGGGRHRAGVGPLSCRTAVAPVL